MDDKITSGESLTVLYTLNPPTKFDMETLNYLDVLKSKNVVHFSCDKSNNYTTVSKDKIEEHIVDTDDCRAVQEFLKKWKVRAFPALVTYKDGEETSFICGSKPILAKFDIKIETKEHVTKYNYIMNDGKLIEHKYIINEELRKTLQTTKLSFQLKVVSLMTSPEAIAYMKKTTTRRVTQQFPSRIFL